jgi:hypothetical protein
MGVRADDLADASTRNACELFNWESAATPVAD